MPLFRKIRAPKMPKANPRYMARMMIPSSVMYFIYIASSASLMTLCYFLGRKMGISGYKILFLVM